VPVHIREWQHLICATFKKDTRNSSYFPARGGESCTGHSVSFSIGAGPNIIANWEQNSDFTWTVPVGIGVSKTLQFGKIPVRE
jgi:hypothetical protein